MIPANAAVYAALFLVLSEQIILYLSPWYFQYPAVAFSFNFFIAFYGYGILIRRSGIIENQIPLLSEPG